MQKRKLLSCTVAVALSGCATTSSEVAKTPVVNPAPVPAPVVQPKKVDPMEELGKSYIGRSFSVMVEDAYVGVREDIYDGMVIKVKSYKVSHYGFLSFQFTDEFGDVLFDKYYTLGDVGAVDESKVDVSVSQAKVNKPIGSVSHGGSQNFPDKPAYKSVIKKERGEGVYGYVRNVKFSNGKGVGLQCTNGNISLTVASDSVFAAPSTAVEYKIFVDEGKVMKGFGSMFSNSYDTAKIKITPNMKAQLKSGYRVAFKVYGRTDMVSGVDTLSGFNEAYSRLEKWCE